MMLGHECRDNYVTNLERSLLVPGEKFILSYRNLRRSIFGGHHVLHTFSPFCYYTRSLSIVDEIIFYLIRVDKAPAFKLT